MPCPFCQSQKFRRLVYNEPLRICANCGATAPPRERPVYRTRQKN